MKLSRISVEYIHRVDGFLDYAFAKRVRITKTYILVKGLAIFIGRKWILWEHLIYGRF